MKQAFLIIAHNEPDVLLTLLRQLDADGADLFVHVDRRADELYRRAAAWQPRHAGYRLLRRRLAVCWGDVSQVDVELLLFRTALAAGRYEFFHLLSGQDLLLRPAVEVMAFFSAHRGREFVHTWQSAGHRRDLRRKVMRQWLFTRHMKDRGTLAHALAAPVRNVFILLQRLTGYRRRAGYDFAKGSNWVSVTADFCAYIVSAGPALRRRLRHTLCPDEVFVQTLLHSSPFAANVYDSADDICRATLRLIDWERGHPYVWQPADYDELRRSGALFARKFSGQTPTLLERLERDR